MSPVVHKNCQTTVMDMHSSTCGSPQSSREPPNENSSTWMYSGQISVRSTLKKSPVQRNTNVNSKDSTKPTDDAAKSNISKPNINNLRIYQHFPESLIIHSFSPNLRAVSNLKSSNFNDSIVAALEIAFRHIADIPALHKYTWPLAMRGQNVCAIFADDSKHLVPYIYIPVVLSVLVGNCSKCVPATSSQITPACIILVNGVTRCYQVKSKILHIISRLTTDECAINAVIASAHDMETYTRSFSSSAHHNIIDVLITTPKALMNCMPFLDLRNLSHVIVDVYYAPQNHLYSMESVLDVVNDLRVSQNSDALQYIVCTSKWSEEFWQLLASINHQPNFVFENYLEASCYGRMDISKKTLETGYKNVFLEDLFRTKANCTKIVAFCNDNEFDQLREYLQFRLVEIVYIDDYMSDEEIAENQLAWTTSNGRILLCTDETFAIMQDISNASLIVHYSIPDNWNTFTKRFRAFKQNISAHFYDTNTSHSSKSVIRPQCCFLLDKAESEGDLFCNVVNHLARAGLCNQRPS